jgi:hypothetical protein
MAIMATRVKPQICPFNPKCPADTIPEQPYSRPKVRIPDTGRLYQVEYAMEAISHAGICIGITTPTGVLLVGEKSTSPLLEHTREKVFKLNDSANDYEAKLKAQYHFCHFQRVFQFLVEDGNTGRDVQIS